MDNRKADRVQFFQLGTGKDISQVWVFRQTYPGATLGLLLDIGTEGAQVLTNKADELDGKSYPEFNDFPLCVADLRGVTPRKAAWLLGVVSKYVL